MKIWAHVNIGHCGGYWLLNICRDHPSGRLWAWGEAPTNPKYSPILLEGETLRDYIARERAAGNLDSVGFIKSRAIVDYCSRHGRVIRAFRNPIEVVGKKTAAYWQAIAFPKPDATIDLTSHIAQIEKTLGRAMKTERDHFVGYLPRLADLHRWLLNFNPSWPLVKLEELNRSIGTDGLYFRRMMRYLTQIDWPMDYIERIRVEYLPNPETEESGDFTIPPHDAWQDFGWLYDPLPVRRWQSWDQDQRQMFLAQFKDIMIHFGYGW